MAKAPPEHYCDDLQGSTKLHGKWQENFLNCRECYRKLVLFIAKYFLAMYEGTFSRATRFTLQELLKGPSSTQPGLSVETTSLNLTQPLPAMRRKQIPEYGYTQTNWFQSDSHSVTRYRHVPHRTPTTMCCTQQYHHASEYFQLPPAKTT